MIAYRTGLVKDAIGMLADTRLRQSETLVHVAMEKAQHFSAVYEARVLDANVSGRNGRQSPESLLKRSVNSMYGIIHQVNVLKEPTEVQETSDGQDEVFEAWSLPNIFQMPQRPI